MDPYNFDPFNNPMLREMELLSRLNDEMNWIDRIDRQINPLKHMANVLNPLERMADEVNSLEHIAHEVNPAEHLIAAQEAASKCIQEAAMPLPDFTLPQITPEESAHLINELRFPIDRIDTHLPEFHFPESHSLDELEQMSDDDLRDLSNRNVSINTALTILHVLEMRQLERVTRPHWTALGTFWSTLIIGVIGVAIGGITVFLMMR